MKHPLSLRPCLPSYFFIARKGERNLKDDNITNIWPRHLKLSILNV